MAAPPGVLSLSPQPVRRPEATQGGNRVAPSRRAPRPPNESFGRRQERTAVKQTCKSLGRRLSAPTFEHREKAEHGGRLFDRSPSVAAVASVPAERSGSERGRLFGEDQEGELEPFGEADVLEFNGTGPGGEEIAVVERASEAPIGRAAGGHANACSQKLGRGAEFVWTNRQERSLDQGGKE